MIIKSFPDKILLPEKRDVLKVHLYLKLMQSGIQPYDKHMDIILELYSFGGYNTAQDQDTFFNQCIDKKYSKSKQSIRNILSKYTKLGVFSRKKNSNLHVNDSFIPNVKFDKVMLEHVVSHAN